MKTVRYLLLLLFLFLPCCTAHMDHLAIDKSFTIDNLVHDGLIWAGLTKQNGKWNSIEQKHYSNVAAQAFSKKRNNFSLHDPDIVIQKIGIAEFSNLKSKFARDGQLQQSAIANMQTGDGGSRYIFFARLTKDIISHHHSTKNEIKDGKKYYFTTYKTVRSTTIEGKVYDLLSNHVVWSGRIKKKVRNTNTNTHDHNENILKDIANELLEDAVFGDYPEDPPLEKSIQKAFTGIAENF